MINPNSPSPVNHDLKDDAWKSFIRKWARMAIIGGFLAIALILFCMVSNNRDAKNFFAILAAIPVLVAMYAAYILLCGPSAFKQNPSKHP